MFDVNASIHFDIYDPGTHLISGRKMLAVRSYINPIKIW